MDPISVVVVEMIRLLMVFKSSVQTLSGTNWSSKTVDFKRYVRFKDPISSGNYTALNSIRLNAGYPLYEQNQAEF